MPISLLSSSSRAQYYYVLKALMAEGGLSASSMPWYGYLAIGGVVALLGQAIAKFATDTIKQMEEEEANSSIPSPDNNLK